jgi:hypothetical protein
MASSEPPPTSAISAASLRDREEWRTWFPGAEVVWEEDADEGRGIGFDGLDPRAMVRALLRTPASFADVATWYRERLGGLGWIGAETRPGSWWAWTSPSHPGEQFDLLDRGRWPDRPDWYPGWTIPDNLLGMTGFEVLLRASSSGWGSSSTDA